MGLHRVAAGFLGTVTGLAAPGPIEAQEVSSAVTSKAPAAKSQDGKEAMRGAVGVLAEQLRRHPAEPSKAADRVAGLYMIEVSTGEVTLIADQPDAGITYCGSAAWSNDGKRIVFDAMRPELVHQAHMKLIEVVAGELKMTDLGVGNCPTFSPRGDRIAFLLNHGGVPGAQGGIWSMRADGAERVRLGSFGRPRWSPDGRRFMLIDFAIPAQVRMMDTSGEASVPLEIPDLKLYSPPNWVSDEAIVAVVGTDFGDSIVVIDVTEPRKAKVRETLWKMNFTGKGPDIRPHHPAYLAGTGRCVFIGGSFAGMALYSFEKGQTDPPKRLEPEGFDSLMQDVAISPDGRYALFTGSRTGARQRGSAPSAKATGPKEGADKK